MVVMNTDRQVLSWDCSPGERLQAFPWHPSHSYQRTDYTDFEHNHHHSHSHTTAMTTYSLTQCSLSSGNLGAREDSSVLV